ncbi:hypothetical protein TRVA0_049S00430 [Trichomonascus vanleenenianus]|uniref:pepsin-like aspartic protease n=1 Tax=Trichomonascus vanleenenianus TaxID=2268995 RepID=UPI003ECAEB5D
MPLLLIEFFFSMKWLTVVWLIAAVAHCNEGEHHQHQPIAGANQWAPSVEAELAQHVRRGPALVGDLDPEQRSPHHEQPLVQQPQVQQPQVQQPQVQQPQVQQPQVQQPQVQQPQVQQPQVQQPQVQQVQQPQMAQPQAQQHHEQPQQVQQPKYNILEKDKHGHSKANSIAEKARQVVQDTKDNIDGVLPEHLDAEAIVNNMRREAIQQSLKEKSNKFAAKAKDSVEYTGSAMKRGIAQLKATLGPLMGKFFAPTSNDNQIPGGVIKAPVVKKPLPRETRRSLSKRAPISGNLENLVDFYTITVEVGSPGQKVELLLDTGSSDLWVYGPNASSDPTIPHFDPGKSATWHSNQTRFHINYVTGSATGEWGTDVVNINGAKVQSQSLAVVTRGNSLEGVPGLMGVGLTALESSNRFFFGQYSNVPMSLYHQGYIKSPTYSLYLDDVGAQSGSILFGGVDHAKYKGQLYLFQRTSSMAFDVRVDSLSVDGQNVGQFTATLDSGTSLGLLPNRVLRPFTDRLNLHYDDSSKSYYYNKNEKMPDHKIDFVFSGVKYTLKTSDLLVDSSKLGDPFSQGRLIFGFQSSNDNSNAVILGDVFLRKFYVVYDCAHAQIAMAEASYKNSSSIQAIDSESFPKALKAPGGGRNVPDIGGGIGGLLGGIFGGGGGPGN